MTAKDGEATLDGLALGVWAVLVKSNGHATAWKAPILLTEHGMAAELRVVLSPGRVVTGVIVDLKGAPVAGCRVTATDMVGSGLIAGHALSDSLGRFTMGGLRDGAQDRIGAQKVGYGRGTREGARAGDDVRLALRPLCRIDLGGLAGTSRDDSAELFVVRLVDGEGGQEWAVTAPGRQWSKGKEATTVYVEQGMVYLVYRWRDSGGMVGPVMAVPGRLRIHARDARRCRVVGRVVAAATQQAVTGAQVAAWPVRLEGHGVREWHGGTLVSDATAWPFTSRTDSAGRFALDGMTPGEWRIALCGDQGMVAWQDVRVEEETALGTWQVAASGRLRGQVAFVDGWVPWGGRVTALASMDGDPAARIRQTTLDLGGGFDIPGLKPGEYDVEVQAWAPRGDGQALRKYTWRGQVRLNGQEDAHLLAVLDP